MMRSNASERALGLRDNSRPRACRTGRTSGVLFFLLRGSGNQTFPNCLFPRKLVHAAYRIRPLPCRFLRRLLVKSASAHFPEHALALHLLLEHTERLLDVVVSNKYLQEFHLAFGLRDRPVPACQPMHAAAIVNEYG
jgi:hypothetical protein